jgi:hypothetical protein
LMMARVSPGPDYAYNAQHGPYGLEYLQMS